MTQPNYGTPAWAQGAPAAAPAPTTYTVGQVVNGHMFNGTGWVPAPPAPPPPAPAQVAPPPPPPAAYAPPPNPGPTAAMGVPPGFTPAAPVYGAPPGVPAGFAPRVPQGDAAALIAAGGGFAGVGDAKTFARGTPFPLGEFVIDVIEVKANISQNPKSQGAPQMIIISEVVSSTVPTAIGGTYSQVINVSKFGKPDVKGFIGACLGADPGRPEQLEALNAQGAFSEASIIQICGPSQPFGGKKRRLRLVTFLNKSGNFTKHQYSPMTAGPVPGQ